MDDQVGSCVAEQIDDGIDIAMQGERCIAATQIELGQSTVAANIRSMDFDAGDRQCVDQCECMEVLLVGLAGESDHNVGDGIDPPAGECTDGPLEIPFCIAHVHLPRGMLGCGLESKLDPDITAWGKRGEQIGDRFIDTVGSGSDGECADTRVLESIAVFRCKDGDGGIGIGEALEVCDESADPAPSGKDRAAPDLFGDGRIGRGNEISPALFPAEKTAAPPDVSIAVGAGKPGIHADFTDLFAEFFAQEVIEIAVEREHGRAILSRLQGACEMIYLL